MMMIIYSFVKIITVQKIFFYSPKPPSVPWFPLHIATLTFSGQPQICCETHVSSYTHILMITYMTTHNNTQIQSTQTHTHTQKKSYTQS